MALRRAVPVASSVSRMLAPADLLSSTCGMATASDAKPPAYVVFGATGGIGSALAARLARQPGAELMLVARNEQRLQELQSSLGPAVKLVHSLDVLDSKQVEDAISRAATQFGRLDGVANCVGSLILKAAHQTSDAEFDHHIRQSLYSSFNVLRPAVKAMMRSGGGSIAFCSSAVAKHGIANHEAIAAAKGGVVGLMLSAAATYAPKNIRVNAVAPGLTRTPLTSRITGNATSLQASAAMHALKRVGEADEVAAALEFLLHPSNSFVTGQVLGVDGGLGSVKASG